MKLSVISKAIIAASLAVGVSGVANAKHVKYKDVVYKDQAPCCTQLMDGFYVGAQAGYDAYRSHFYVNSTDGAFTDTGSVTGWLGGIFVGYGQYFDTFYLGGEAVGNFGNKSQTIMSVVDPTGDSVNQKMTVKNTFGISLVPGLRIQETVLGYLRLGYDWTSFQSAFNLVNADTGGVEGTSKTKTIGGWDAGIGMEALAYCNWSVRTEYNHVWYSSQNFVNAPGFSSDTNLSDNQYTVGIVYHIS